METTNGGQSLTSEPSVSTAIERLVVASQGVITKRIDLALLEGQELLLRTVRGAVIASVGMMLAAAAWFAFVACLIEWIVPDQSWALRLGSFALGNAVVAGWLVIIGMRPFRQPITNDAITQLHESVNRRAAA